MIAIPLLTWASPAFPIGAFAHSGGLEASVARGLVGDEASLADWLCAQMEGGAMRADAIVVSLAAMRAAPDEAPALAALDELAVALAGSPTRRTEMLALGGAFTRAAEGWWPADLARPRSYAAAFGALAGAHAIAPRDAALAFVHAGLINGVQAAQRTRIEWRLASHRKHWNRLAPVIEGQAEAVREVTEQLAFRHPAADAQLLDRACALPPGAFGHATKGQKGKAVGKGREGGRDAPLAA